MKIISEIDLDDLLTLPSNTFYQLLFKIKKEVFEDDERIILNAYLELPKSLISHIKWALDYVDIPIFFVILRTNNDQNKKSLELLTIENLNKTKNLIDHGHRPRFDHFNLCAYLNSGLHVWTDGTVSPCCDFSGKLTDELGQDFNIHKTNLQTIFNSDHMNNLRSSFLNDQKPKSCEMCWVREESNLDSRRTLASFRLKNIYGNINWESKNDMQYIGSHPTNHCNLSCRICSSKFSTVIQAEDKKHGFQTSSFKPAIDPLYHQINELEKLRVFEILGGEPFLMDKNLKFIEALNQKGLDKESIFSFTTNGTTFPNFLNKDFNFQRLDITISIDDINERFEYQRNKAKWLILLDNIEKYKEFKAKKQNVMLGVHVTISILNVLYLPELVNWYNTTGLDYVDYSFLDIPKQLCIKNMTQAAKDLVNFKLGDEFKFVKNVVNLAVPSDGKDFVYYIQQRDKVRKQDFSLNHPEIAKAMGFPSKL